jgi:Spy/CpxP family protein refolding chaperone
MRSSNRLSSLFFMFVLISALPLAACGGTEPTPEVAPPPAPPPPVTASAAPAPAPSAAPPPSASAVVEAPPAPSKPKLNHRHPVVALFLMSLDSLALTADQKTTIDGIKVDLAKHAEAAKEPREKLEADVAAGVLAGKLDQAKVDADIRAMSAAVAATQTAIQDDMNRLHQALTAEQRKKLIETAREKGKEMHQHGMAMHEHDGKGSEHEHGHEHEHDGKGGEHEHDGNGMWQGPLAKLGEELSLTAEQAAKLHTKVEALVKAQQATMKGKMAATEKHLAAVGAAFESDKFDAKKAGVGTQAADLVSSVASERVQFVQAVLSVLTPEQRPKFLAHIQAHNAEMD